MRQLLDRFPGLLRPVVGYAVPEGADEATSHVWAVDTTGDLVDVTWRNRGRLYFGMEVEPWMLNTLWSARGQGMAA